MRRRNLSTISESMMSSECLRSCFKLIQLSLFKESKIKRLASMTDTRWRNDRKSLLKRNCLKIIPFKYLAMGRITTSDWNGFKKEIKLLSKDKKITTLNKQLDSGFSSIWDVSYCKYLKKSIKSVYIFLEILLIHWWSMKKTEFILLFQTLWQG